MLHFIDSADAELPPNCARAAIVSVVMGERYWNSWTRLCENSWRAYADRIGADIIILRDRIDKSDVSRSPAWQKLLILDAPWAKRYPRIIWLDSDIIISDHALDILRYAGPPDKIGLCINGARLSPAESQIYVESVCKVTVEPFTDETAWRHVQKVVYDMNNLPSHEIQYNTGVMVLSPEHHNDLFLSTYKCPQVTHLYEQPHLSHHILEKNLGHTLSPRFNWGLIESFRMYFYNGLSESDDPEFIGRAAHLLIRAELHNAYFLHFYAAMNLLDTYANLPAFRSQVQAAA